MTKRGQIERLKSLLADAHAEREMALAEVVRLQRRRVAEPGVDRYFNGGGDYGNAPLVAAPVFVEHTGPYRSNVTFGGVVTTTDVRVASVFDLFARGEITEAERDEAIGAIAALGRLAVLVPRD